MKMTDRDCMVSRERHSPLKYSEGFTLVEVLLSVAFFGILITASYPVYQSAQLRNDAILTANAIEQSVHRATLLARSGTEDSSWGVDVRAGVVTLFSGTSYDDRDTNFDESVDIPEDVTISENISMVFAPLTGVQVDVDSITLSTIRGEVVTLTINENGVVERE